MKSKLTALTLAATLATGCATPGPNPQTDWPEYVTPLADGTQISETSSQDKDRAMTYAVLFARAACDSEHKALAVIDRNTEKGGLVKSDEGTAIAQTLAGITGTSYYTAGLIGDYTAAVKFTCD